MEYEIFYLIGASKEAELEKIKKEAEEIITSCEGAFLEKETSEKRKLSYGIKKETHGIYIAKRFELENGENIQKITHKLNLNNNILRFVISRADELPELKSKEERIESGKKEDRKIEEKKEIPAKIQKEEAPKEISPAPEKKESKEETKDAEKTDIDKKLEEILNI